MKNNLNNFKTKVLTIFILVLAVLLFANLSAFALKNNFSDVKKSDWFYKSVLEAVDIGLTNGYEDNTFRPNNKVVLSEVLKVALEIKDIEYEILPGAKWYDNIQEVSNKNKIYTGNTKIDKEVTRKDVVDIVFNILDGKEEVSKIDFKDHVDGKVGFLVNRDIINGYKIDGKNYFKPNNNITRAEFFTIMSKVYSYSDVDRNLSEGFSNLNMDKNLKFNEDIKNYYDIKENMMYKVLNDRDIFTVKSNPSVKFADFRDMTFEAHQVLNDKYPEYFSYYNMTTVGEDYIGNDKYYYAQLKVPQGNRYDNKSHIQRRNESLKVLDDIVDNLISNGQINSSNKDIDNARVIYDYILDNIEYFDDERTDKDIVDYDSFDVYGFTHKNKGVCQAYVGSLNYMLRKVGIEAVGVAGKDIYDDIPHVWTKAVIDGKEVYIDPTFGGQAGRDKYFIMDRDFYEKTYIERKYKYDK